MQKTFLKILIILISLSAGYTAFSQGGSNYSTIGLGDIFPSSSALYDGLGGTSIAILKNHGINTTNPALWSRVYRTRLQVGYRFNQYLTTVGDDNVAQNTGGLDGLSALFSIDSSLGISASIGIYSYSSIRYMIASNFDFTDNDVNVKGQHIYQGAGGLSTAYLGGSVNIIDDLSFGAQAMTTFGMINSSVNTLIDGISTVESLSQRKDHFRDFGWKAGLIYTGIDNLSLGAYMEQHSESDVTTDHHFLSLLAPDSTISDTNALTLPSSFGFGASYKLGKFLFGVDYAVHDFTDFLFRTNDKVELRDMKRYSFSISRLGNRRLSASYLDKVCYNLGGGYRELYYSYAGTPINEYYMSLGFELPVKDNAMIDAAITIGSRGENINGLPREMFGRLTIDISIGEIWFVPFKRDY